MLTRTSRSAQAFEGRKAGEGRVGWGKQFCLAGGHRLPHCHHHSVCRAGFCSALPPALLHLEMCGSHPLTAPAERKTTCTNSHQCLAPLSPCAASPGAAQLHPHLPPQRKPLKLPGKEGPACSLNSKQGSGAPSSQICFQGTQNYLQDKKPAVLLSKLTRYFALKYSFFPCIKGLLILVL